MTSLNIQTNGYCEKSLLYLVYIVLDQYTVKHLLSVFVPNIIVGTIRVGNWNLKAVSLYNLSDIYNVELIGYSSSAIETVTVKL
jgi:hypothetical protein